jgi:hypothetical protein
MEEQRLVDYAANAGRQASRRAVNVDIGVQQQH